MSAMIKKPKNEQAVLGENIKGNLRCIDFHVGEIVRLLDLVKSKDGLDRNIMYVRKNFLIWNKSLFKKLG